MKTYSVKPIRTLEDGQLGRNMYRERERECVCVYNKEKEEEEGAARRRNKYT
jgi:hypothetical protein